jgi:hypothetical protein
VRVAVEEPGVVGRNVTVRFRLPPAGMVTGKDGRLPSAKDGLLRLTFDRLTGAALGFKI